MLIGTGRVLEIWSPANLGETLEEATPDEEALFASLIEPTNSTETPSVG